MPENELVSRDYLETGRLLQLELDLIIKLQKRHLSNKKRRKTLRTLEQLEGLRRTKDYEHDLRNIVLTRTSESITFLPGDNLFIDGIKITGGLPEMEAKVTIPPVAQSSCRTFLPGAGTVFEYNHQK